MWNGLQIPNSSNVVSSLKAVASSGLVAGFGCMGRSFEHEKQALGRSISLGWHSGSLISYDCIEVCTSKPYDSQALTTRLSW